MLGTVFVCQKCGACCRIPNGIVRVSDAEIARIADFLGMTEAEFIERGTELAPDRRGLVLKSRPDGACEWLTDDNLCRINPVKPDKCRTFPQEWTNSDSRDICPGLAACFDERKVFDTIPEKLEHDFDATYDDVVKGCTALLGNIGIGNTRILAALNMV